MSAVFKLAIMIFKTGHLLYSKMDSYLSLEITYMCKSLLIVIKNKFKICRSLLLAAIPDNFSSLAAWILILK